MMSLSACELTDDDKENIDSAFTPPTVEDPSDTSDEEPYCTTERFVQPEGEVVKKLDLLFVVDTSGSLNAERRDIVDGNCLSH